MTTPHDPTPLSDDALRWQLRALRQDMPPTRDLWPGIAARLATSPRHQAPVRPRRPWTPFALAASVLLAITVTWQLQQAPTGDPLIQREAAALTRDYAGALAQLDRQVAAPPEIAPALHTLDESAAVPAAASPRAMAAEAVASRWRRSRAVRRYAWSSGHPRV